MSKLYDTILHSTFAGPGAKYAFVFGLKLRSVVFAIRNAIGWVFFRPKKRTLDLSRIAKILLIRTDRIGDIILSTPALMALRKHYPQARIDYLVQEKYASLLNCYEGWDNVIPVDINDSGKLRAIGRKLKQNNYDVVVVQHPAQYAYALAKASKAPCIIGWKAKGFGYILTHGFVDDRGKADRHQVENNLKLLEPLGVVEASPTFPVKETEAGKKQYSAFCEKYGLQEGDRIIAIHPGSYSPRVRWMPARFGELIDKAHDAGFKVVLLGGKNDAVVIHEVLNGALNKPIVAQDEMDFEGLISLFKHTKVFVGNSTGPTHLAASAGAWTIALFGNRYPMDRWELWKPWGSKGIVVTSPKYQCSNCTPWTCAHLECLTSISVEDVWKEVLEIGERN